MRVLHTSDWHVGKVLKGHSRVPDQIAVLAAVVNAAREHRPDLVVISGDLYDSSAPSAEATRIVTRALSALRATGAEVVAIAGNHDNGNAMEALRPWADAAGITLRGSVRSVEDLTVTGKTRDGEPWRMAMLPFLSQRFAVRASEMFELTPAEANQTYADHVARLIAALTAGFDQSNDGTVNLVAAHLTAAGATVGGGEREAHTIMGYTVPPAIFPPSVNYVALGHLHRAQRVNGPCPIRYSGSPIAVDFGDGETTGSISMVELSATKAAQITEVPIRAGTPLRTVRGSLEYLSALEPQDAMLRVFVTETPRAGLREEVQALLPTAIEVRIDPSMLPATATAARAGSTQRATRSPGQLFAEYLDQRGSSDPELVELFHGLHEEVLRS